MVWWLALGLFVWVLIFFPFNLFYMRGLCKKNEEFPEWEQILSSLLIGPFFLIIPMFFFICLLAETLGLWTIRWAGYNLSLQKEDEEKENKDESSKLDS